MGAEQSTLNSRPCPLRLDMGLRMRRRPQPSSSVTYQASALCCSARAVVPPLPCFASSLSECCEGNHGKSPPARSLGELSAQDYNMRGKAFGGFCWGQTRWRSRVFLSVQQDRTSSAFWVMTLLLETSNFMGLDPSNRLGPEKWYPTEP